MIVLGDPGEGKLLPGSKADAPSQLLRGLAGTVSGSIVLTVLDRLKDERLDDEAESAAFVTVILELVEVLGGESEATVEALDPPVETCRGVAEVLEVDVSTAAVTTGVAGSIGAGAVGTPKPPTLALISVERAPR